MLVGVDEAGRGPLAGAVVACALYLKVDPPFTLGRVPEAHVHSATSVGRREKFREDIQPASNILWIGLLQTVVLCEVPIRNSVAETKIIVQNPNSLFASVLQDRLTRGRSSPLVHDEKVPVPREVVSLLRMDHEEETLPPSLWDLLPGDLLVHAPVCKDIEHHRNATPRMSRITVPQIIRHLRQRQFGSCIEILPWMSGPRLDPHVFVKLTEGVLNLAELEGRISCRNIDQTTLSGIMRKEMRSEFMRSSFPELLERV